MPETAWRQAGLGGVGRAVDVSKGDREGYGTLEQFVEQDCGGRRVRLGGRNMYTGVVHHDRQQRVLDCERDEAVNEDVVDETRRRGAVSNTHEMYLSGIPQRVGRGAVSAAQRARSS